MTPAPAPEPFRAVNTLFATEVVLNRNVAALDQVYTANATIMPPGAPQITGRENIRAFWKAAIDALNPTAASLDTTSLEVLGDTAIETGRATIESAGSTLEFKYVVVWKREDGSWKLHTDIWNSNS